MAGIDPDRAFLPLNIAVLTVSDTRSQETDTSGGLLIDRLTAAGHLLVARAIVKDDMVVVLIGDRATIEAGLVGKNLGEVVFVGRDGQPAK